MFYSYIDVFIGENVFADNSNSSKILLHWFQIVSIIFLITYPIQGRSGAIQPVMGLLDRLSLYCKTNTSRQTTICTHIHKYDHFRITN